MNPLPQTNCHVNSLTLFAAYLKPRPLNSHKGMMGSVGIVGGASGMIGAAILAGRAALKLGAGRVYIGLLDENALRIDTSQAELMLCSPEIILSSDNATSLVLGPGMGESPQALHILKQAIARDLPLVLDADALNLLATHPVMLTRLSRRTSPTLLTPHPAEAARLLACVTNEVQENRLAAAQKIATKFNAYTVLKGFESIISIPTGERCFINKTGNPGMASAGMGDVLTGLLAALLAQGWPAETALLAAVYLHGLAADTLVDKGIGPIGLTATEVIHMARSIFNDWHKETLLT